MGIGQFIDQLAGVDPAKDSTAAELGKFLGLAANTIQVLQGIGFVASLFSQSDTDKLLDAIGKLQATLDADFAQLGDLIKRQTLMLSQNEDTLALAAALAHSSTGADKLDRFLRTKDQAELSTADTESDLGVQFFLNLPGTSPDPTLVASKVDPVFMPAMAKAGTIRMVVLALRDPGLRTVPNDVNQVNNICDVLTGMIAPVKQAVDQAHTVELKSHELHTAHPGDTGPLIIPDGYFHEEHGRVLEFFSAHGARDFDDPRLDKAAQQAENARQAGVDAELEFLGVPVFEGLVQQWRSLVDKPLVTIPIVTGVGNRAATA